LPQNLDGKAQFISTQLCSIVNLGLPHRSSISIS